MDHQSFFNSYLLIDTARLRKNVRTILGSLPSGTALIPVLKDDAFGLGLAGIAQILAGFPEIDTFAVSQIGEGALLRSAGIDREILVMGGFPSFFAAAALDCDLTVTVGRLGLLPSLIKEAALRKKKVKIQIKIETGLHRIGVTPGDELLSLIAELKSGRAHLSVSGAFSHFADTDDPLRTHRQYALLREGVRQLESAGIPLPRVHLSGSAASERFPQYALDAVRIGRRLYMDHPRHPLGDIEEVASWRSYITNLRMLKAGDTLGYGSRVRLSSDALVATVGVGYGDGLSRALAEKNAPVLVAGRRAKLLACCMDQSFIDVTGIPCQADDEVTFFGYGGDGQFLSSQEVALLAGDDEGCGLTSALSGRVARIYR